MESKNKEETQFNDTKEEDVGITEYIYKENKGFNSVLKHRYSDFLVNELDLQENVVWLKEIKNAESQNKNVLGQSTNKQAELEPEPEVNLVISTEEDVDRVVKEHFELTNLITNERDIQTFRNLLYKFINKELNNDDRIEINFIDDKNNRKIFHEKVRKLFDFLDSETLSDAHGGSSFINTQKNKQNNKGKGGKDRRDRKSSPKKETFEDPNIPVEEFIKKMVIFVNKNKTNFFKKRKIFADSSKNILHFSMLKRNLDTVQAISYIARMLKRSYKTIKFAGNKDKRGITTQRISAYSTMAEELMNLTNKPFWDKRIMIGNYSFKEEELRLGALKGNQFSVVFRFVELENNNSTFEETKNEMENSLKSLQENGFINYFGMQRFGVSSVPTHKVGLNVLKANWKDAVICILHTNEVKEALKQIGLFKECTNEDGSVNFQKFSDIFESPSNITDVLKIIPKYSYEHRILTTIKKTGKNSHLTAFKSLNRQLQLLYPHAYQSYIWNSSVSMRIKNHGLNILLGDIVKKKTASNDTEILLQLDEAEENGGDNEEIINDVEEKEEEIIPVGKNSNMTEKVDLDKIFEDNYEYITQENIKKYSFEDLYFPVIGYKIKFPKNETVNYINELLKIDDIKIQDFSTDNLNFNSTGYFRKVIERPKAMKYELLVHDDPDEDLQTEHYNIKPHPIPIRIENNYTSLRLQFQLPQSTYATMLFRELTKRSSAANYQASLSKLVKKFIK